MRVLFYLTKKIKIKSIATKIIGKIKQIKSKTLTGSSFFALFLQSTKKQINSIIATTAITQNKIMHNAKTTAPPIASKFWDLSAGSAEAKNKIKLNIWTIIEKTNPIKLKVLNFFTIHPILQNLQCFFCGAGQ